MRISDWSSDVCSSDLAGALMLGRRDVVGGLIATGAVACSPPPVSNDIETREPDQPPVTFEPSPDLAAIATRSGGRLGVAALDTGSGRRIGHDQDARYALCSTFKAPLAAAQIGRASCRERMGQYV